MESLAIFSGQHIRTGLKLSTVPCSHRGPLRSGTACPLGVVPWRKRSSKLEFGDVYMLLGLLLKLHSWWIYY